MAYVEEGSRIADSARNALAARNANYQLSGLSEKIVYAIQVRGGVGGDQMDAELIPAQGLTDFKFRVSGVGAFSSVTSTTPVRVTQNVADTALTNDNVVTDAEDLANNGTGYVAAGKEAEAVNFPTTYEVLIRVKGTGQATEWQIGLDFANAANSTDYEFQAVFVQKLGTDTVTCTARILTPAGGGGPTGAIPTRVFIIS